MPGVSIHVVDVSRGTVAVGMRVELAAAGVTGERLIVAGRIGASGQLSAPELDRIFAPGFYVARFYIAEFYRTVANNLPPVPFLDVVSYRFGLADPDSHYHLPMKCTPWGYSCFRGGA